MRTLSGTLEAIFENPSREIDHLVMIVFPTRPTLRMATAPLTAMSETWTNDVNAIGELRHSLESPVDRVSVRLQNVDGVLAADILAHYEEWQRAECVIYRQYRSGSLTETVEMFRGGVQRPEVSDAVIEFEVLADVRTAGAIVSTRNLGALCPWKFKDTNCGYSGGETECNKLLKSPGGCEGRENTHRFGGWEQFEASESSPPGTGGNEGNEIPPPPRPPLEPPLD